MKNNKVNHVLFLMLIASSLTFCQREQHDNISKSESVKKKPEPVEQSGEVKLNDGQRWKVNPATREGVHFMRTWVEKHNPGNGWYQKRVTDSLEASFTIIFQKCTMTGEGHNQLHNYLIPIGTLLDEMAKADSLAWLNHKNSLQKRLHTFEMYFD